MLSDQGRCGLQIARYERTGLARHYFHEAGFRDVEARVLADAIGDPLMAVVSLA